MNYTLNGKTYKIPELTYNAVCDLEDKGINLLDLGKGKVKLGFIREIIALSFGGNSELAGIEIENHIKNGGSFEDLATVVAKSVENSGFFQALSKQGDK
jgi:hypothetical protein